MFLQNISLQNVIYQKRKYFSSSEYYILPRIFNSMVFFINIFSSIIFGTFPICFPLECFFQNIFAEIYIFLLKKFPILNLFPLQRYFTRNCLFLVDNFPFQAISVQIMFLFIVSFHKSIFRI